MQTDSILDLPSDQIGSMEGSLGIAYWDNKDRDFDFDLEKARRMEVEIGKFCLNAVSVRREIEQTNKSNYVLHTQFKLLSSSDSW